MSRSSARRVSVAGLARTQAKLSCEFNQVARGRIRRFESYMPSHAVALRERGKMRSVMARAGVAALFLPLLTGVT